MKTKNGLITRIGLITLIAAGLGLPAPGQTPNKETLKSKGYYSLQHPEWPSSPTAPAGLTTSVANGKTYYDDTKVVYHPTPQVRQSAVKVLEPWEPVLNIPALKQHPEVIAKMRERYAAHYGINDPKRKKPSWWEHLNDRLSRLEDPAHKDTVQSTDGEVDVFVHGKALGKDKTTK